MATERPRCDQRTLFLVNVFIVNTVELLNKLSAACEKKLAQVHQRILRVDAALSLLEAKLRSVDVDVAPQSTAVQAADAAAETSSGSLQGDEAAIDEGNLQAPPQAAVDPRLIKFVKMQQVGVPQQAVKLQMSLEGVDPSLLDDSRA